MNSGFFVQSCGLFLEDFRIVSQACSALARFLEASRTQADTQSQLPSILYSAKSDAKQSAILRGIGQALGQHVLTEIKSIDGLFEGIVFIHRNDVLKAKLLCNLRTKAQCADDLASVNAIE